MGERIGVIGAGAWGTVLAALLSRKGKEVVLWAHEPEVVEQINRRHINTNFLPDISLPPDLSASHTLADVVRGARYILLVCPSHVVRHVATRLAPDLARDAIVVTASKGIEIDTGKLISEVLAEALPHHATGRCVYLSGPSFAKEVAQEQPTAVVIAGHDPAVTATVQALFRTPFFLTFCHDDPVGVQIGGAVKNILAIAAGILDGLRLGHNTRAAMITRGLYEIMKLGRALGANPLTFVGLAGLGDLILTCTGDLSRNRAVGIALGQGRSMADIAAGTRTVAEGIATAKAVYMLIQTHRIKAPICTAVYDILYAGKPPRQAVTELSAMELHEELGALLNPPESIQRAPRA